MQCPKPDLAMASMGMAIAKTMPPDKRKQTLVATEIAKNKSGRMKSMRRVRLAQLGTETTCLRRRTRPTIAEDTCIRTTVEDPAHHHERREAAIGAAHTLDRVVETPDDTTPVSYTH